MQTSKKEKREFKLFLIYTGALLLAISGFFMIRSHAEEVTVAEAPFNVGGNNESDSASSIIDISDGGSNQSVQSLAPNIIYAPTSADGGFVISIDNDSDSDSNSSSEDTRPSIILSGTTGSSSETDQQDLETGKYVEAENGDEVYVPDSEDDCPVSNAVRLPVDVQHYIWTKCKQVTGDYKNYYAFILGAIELESDFKRTAIHYNDNGTVDRGLMQINSCNIKSCKRAGLITCTDDLWDIYKNIDCGFHEMNDYIKKFGVCESAYYAYNTGRQNGGSNYNSRTVMQNMSKWNVILFG